MSESAKRTLENQVLFELNRRLASEDLDIMSLYLENRKQSGGGDILLIEELDNNHITCAASSAVSYKRTLRVVYEEAAVCQRILKKKFFQFQNYFMRSSENGYKLNDIYEIDRCRIILKNINKNEEVNI